MSPTPQEHSDMIRGMLRTMRGIDDLPDEPIAISYIAEKKGFAVAWECVMLVVQPRYTEHSAFLKEYVRLLRKYLAEGSKKRKQPEGDIWEWVKNYYTGNRSAYIPRLDLAWGGDIISDDEEQLGKDVTAALVRHFGNRMVYIPDWVGTIDYKESPMYPRDRVKGYVWLSVPDGKYYITGLYRAARFPKSVRRVVYRMCKHLHLNPKRWKEWYYYG